MEYKNDNYLKNENFLNISNVEKLTLTPLSSLQVKDKNNKKNYYEITKNYSNQKINQKDN